MLLKCKISITRAVRHMCIKPEPVGFHRDLLKKSNRFGKKLCVVALFSEDRVRHDVRRARRVHQSRLR